MAPWHIYQNDIYRAGTANIFQQPTLASCPAAKPKPSFVWNGTGTSTETYRIYTLPIVVIVDTLLDALR